MNLYRVKDNYMTYLNSFDSMVPFNKNQKRVYVGVALHINNSDFFIPLTSPKDKHKTMKSTSDFILLNKGIFGALNINNMVPVKKNELVKIDIAAEPNPAYSNLLMNQYTELISIKDKISNHATKTYNIHLKPDSDCTPNELKIKSRCCNFSLLEHACENYNIKTSEKNLDLSSINYPENER